MNRNETVRSGKLRLFETLNLQAGDHILDVGCGLGHDAQVLAKMVGKTGRVIGIDQSKILIQEAKRRIRSLNLPIEFRVADAHHLSFADNSFDGCLIVATFTHLAKPQKVIGEIVRVLKPGARLVSLEVDWDTFVMTADKHKAARTVTKILQKCHRNSGIAHCLPALLSHSGLKEIAVGAGNYHVRDFAEANDIWRIRANVDQARSAGALSMTQASTVLSQLEEASRTGLFFAASTSFGVVGTKP
jgi:ubiquinone/menaquinone biosynthesis C-methylase UbiE